MRTLRHLEEEHQLIHPIFERALAALAPFDGEGLAHFVDFFVRFVDHVHELGEEQILFAALREHGGGLAEEVLEIAEREHVVARRRLRVAVDALPSARGGDVEALSRLEGAVRSYIELMRGHIEREHSVLFPLAERVLSPLLDAHLAGLLESLEREAASREALAHWSELAGRPYLARPVPIASAVPVSAGAVSFATSDPEHSTSDEAPDAPFRPGFALFDEDGHQALLLNDFGRGLAIQANQYLIVHGGRGLVIDPGGPKVYPHVLAELKRHLPVASLQYIFLSHQDPDIGTSLNAWLMDTPAEAYISRLWMRFLPHFGVDSLLAERLLPIPDEGLVVHLGGAPLYFLPAHFLHSPGNFQVYDPISKVLFSGDLGAAVDGASGVVTDFDAHAQRMLAFHRRYMASERAMNAWVKMVRTLDIETIAPQHGGIFKGGEMVKRLIDWCEGLRCGVDLLEELTVPR